MIVNIKIPHKVKPIFEGMIGLKLQTPAGLETICFDLTFLTTLGQLLAFLDSNEIMQIKILQVHRFLWLKFSCWQQ